MRLDNLKRKVAYTILSQNLQKRFRWNLQFSQVSCKGFAYYILTKRYVNNLIEIKTAKLNY